MEVPEDKDAKDQVTLNSEPKVLNPAPLPFNSQPSTLPTHPAVNPGPWIRVGLSDFLLSAISGKAR